MNEFHHNTADFEGSKQFPGGNFIALIHVDLCILSI